MTVPTAPLKQKWHLSGPGGGTVQTKPHRQPAPCRWCELANCLPLGKFWKEQLFSGNLATLRALTDPAKRPLFPCPPRAEVGAHWASWADCVLMVRRRHPVLAETWIHNFAHRDAPCFLAVRSCKNWQMQVWRCPFGRNCQILL